MSGRRRSKRNRGGRNEFVHEVGGGEICACIEMFFRWIMRRMTIRHESIRMFGAEIGYSEETRIKRCEILFAELFSSNPYDVEMVRKAIGKQDMICIETAFFKYFYSDKECLFQELGRETWRNNSRAVDRFYTNCYREFLEFLEYLLNPRVEVRSALTVVADRLVGHYDRTMQWHEENKARDREYKEAERVREMSIDPKERKKQQKEDRAARKKAEKERRKEKKRLDEQIRKENAHKYKSLKKKFSRKKF